MSTDVYVSIGNSDDKLSQVEWSRYCQEVREALGRRGSYLGVWYSLPDSPWQNACFCLQFETPYIASLAAKAVQEIRLRYHQDSAAWAEVPVTDFI